MPRSMRLLIVIAVMALVGVTALAWMARRYATLVPEKSVQDLTPDVPAPEPPPAPAVPEPSRTEPGPGTAAPAASASAPAPAPAPAPAETAASRDVDAFIAVRRPLRELVDGNPKGFRQIHEQGENPPKPGDVFNANLILLSNFRIRREEKLRETGLALDRYAAIRSAYRSWKEGAGSVAPDLAAAFSARAADLSAVELGDGEYLDEQMTK